MQEFNGNGFMQDLQNWTYELNAWKAFAVAVLGIMMVTVALMVETPTFLVAVKKSLSL